MSIPQLLTPRLARASARARAPGLVFCLLAALACKGSIETNTDVRGVRPRANSGDDGASGSATSNGSTGSSSGAAPIGGAAPGSTGETGTDNIRLDEDTASSGGSRRGGGGRARERDDDERDDDERDDDDRDDDDEDIDAGLEQPEADAGVLDGDAGVVEVDAGVELDAGSLQDAGAAPP